MTSENRAERIAGGAVGALFVATGAFKLLAPASTGFEGGGRGFSHALHTLGVPLPSLFGWGVPLLEVGGGLVLLFVRRPLLRAVCCALLGTDMLAAIGLVGVPGRLGSPLRVGDMEIGAEPWRLPLEIGLLGACFYLMVRALRASRR